MLRSPRIIGLLAIVLLVDTAFALMFLAAIQEHIPHDLGGDTAFVGYTLAAFGFVKLALQTFCGAAVDRYSARTTAMAGLALSLLAALLMAFVPSPAVFPALGGLYGAGSALLWPALYAIVASSTDTSGRSQMTAALAVTTGAAVGIAVLGGSMLVDYVSGHAAVVAAAVLAAAAAILAPKLLRDRPVVGSLESSREMSEPNVDGLRVHASRLAKARVALAALVVGQASAAASLVPVIGPFAREELGVEFHRAVISLAPAGLAGVIGLVAGARLASRSGRHIVAAGGAGVAVVGAGILAIAPSVSVAVLGASALAFGYAALFPAVSGLVMDLSRSTSRGRLIGRYMAVEGAGHALGPALTGFVMGRADPEAAVLASVLLLALAFTGAVALVLTSIAVQEAEAPQSSYGLEMSQGLGG